MKNEQKKKFTVKRHRLYLHYIRLSNEELLLQWSPPDFDGGARVTRYRVEADPSPEVQNDYNEPEPDVPELSDKEREAAVGASPSPPVCCTCFS